MGRKIFGVVLYILGTIFILAELTNFKETLSHSIAIFLPNNSERGYSFGFITFKIAFFILIYYIFKFGNRFFKKT